MKRIILILSLLCVGNTWAQIKGSTKIVSREFPANELQELQVNLYATIKIDAAAEPVVRITADENLMERIDTEIVSGKLKLEQLEWIQPSREIVIEIGAPALKRLEVGVHRKVEVTNLNKTAFNAMALLGAIKLSGRVERLSLGSETGELDVSNLIADTIQLNIWGSGKAELGEVGVLNAKLGKEARLVLNKNPRETKGNTAIALANAQKENDRTVRYINFKIRNNSGKRSNFYVIGPKPEGGKFSYGFPMNAGGLRKERWTTGTKIYKTTGMGTRKLLRVIEATDENTTVALFDR